jgi:hypothetical protein
MRHYFKALRNRLFPVHQTEPPAAPPPEKFQVMMPENVVLPLSKTPREQISVPASINGRDLSTGRL